eukprot:scpid80780/ scgid5561/ Cathepsin O
MAFLQTTLTIVLLLASSGNGALHDQASSWSVDVFHRYMQDYQKPYAVGSDEYVKRLNNFKASLTRVALLNAQSEEENQRLSQVNDTIVINDRHRSSPGRPVYGINSFSDLSTQEFIASKQCMHRGNVSQFAGSSALTADEFMSKHADMVTPPDKWDWRNQSVVTEIKNQKSCGSCWAFAAIETIESAWAIKYSRLYSLSVQQLISCNIGTGNSGCNGGRYETAYNWLIQGSRKVDLDAEYPYYDSKGGVLPCREVETKSPVTLTSYQSILNISLATESGLLMRAVYYYGPVAIVVDAASWQDYEGGIIQHHCTAQSLDHAVVIVGYDTTGPIPYWIVRNTWGGSWGHNGYLYIEMNKDLCGKSSACCSR